jgi:hypothetical protein
MGLWRFWYNGMCARTSLGNPGENVSRQQVLAELESLEDVEIHVGGDFGRVFPMRPEQVRDIIRNEFEYTLCMGGKGRIDFDVTCRRTVYSGPQSQRVYWDISRGVASHSREDFERISLGQAIDWPTIISPRTHVSYTIPVKQEATISATDNSRRTDF